MTRTLPKNPSLSILNYQAKQLLKSHKAGEESVCPVLRLHHRFINKPSSQILSEKVTLQETQHALALSYGFDDWLSLRLKVLRNTETTDKEKTHRIAIQRKFLTDHDSQVRLNAAVNLAYEGCADGLDILICGLSHDNVTVRFFQIPGALLFISEQAKSALHKIRPEGQSRIPLARSLALLGEPSIACELIPAVLDEASPDSTWEAIYLCGELGSDVRVAQDAIAKCAKNGSPLAHISLAIVGGNSTLPVLVEGLNHVQEETRTGALRAIAGLGTKAASTSDKLAEMLADNRKSLSERLMAAHTLRCVASPSAFAVQTICHAMKEGDRWLRIGLIRELIKMTPLYDISNIEDVPESPLWASKWVHSISGEAGDALERSIIPLFVKSLQDPDYDIKRNAAFGLAFCHLSSSVVADIEQTEDLCKHLRHEIVHKKRLKGSCSCALWLEEPKADVEAVSELCEKALIEGVDCLDPSVPRWLFLKYLVEQRRMLLHGSSRADIEVLSTVSHSSGNGRPGERDSEPGVFATDLVPLALFYSVVEATTRSTNIVLHNATNGAPRRGYRLGLPLRHISQRPFINATVYVLPRQTFSEKGDGEWVSTVPVKPIAQVPVTGEDFPLLELICGTDLGLLSQQFGDELPHLSELGMWATRRSDRSSYIPATQTLPLA